MFSAVSLLMVPSRVCMIQIDVSRWALELDSKRHKTAVYTQNQYQLQLLFNTTLLAFKRNFT